ncbi:MAG: GAF domain-containing protein, partial [Candidatus Omnitrophica bacterium]|nr:GAF domain-containing protein [Candidatus Omnitrophota bacterium]
MTFNYYTISSILGAFTSLFIGFFVYFKNKKNLINITWLLLSLSVAVWSLGYSILISTTNKEVAILSRKFMDSGAIFIPSFWINFVFSFLGIVKEKKGKLIISYLLSLILLTLNFSPYFIEDLVNKLNFLYYPEPRIGYYVFILHFFFWVIYSFCVLLKAYRISSSFRQNQIRYVIIGALLGFGGGGTAFLITFNIPIPPFGLILFALYPIVIAYAIVKYRLMDIRVAITRTGVFVAVYTIVLGVPFAAAISFKNHLIRILGTNWWIAPLGLMAGLATIGPFVYIFLQRKAEEKLLKEQRRYQFSLKQAAIGMTRIRNLRKLLDLIAHIVTKTVKISYAAIYLYNPQTDEYVLQVARDKGRTPIPKLNSDNPLISWIMVKREPLIYEEVKRLIEDTNNITYKLLEENMSLLTASVIIPSFLEDRFVGFFVLGDKVSGQIYTPEDLDVFQVLASQAALAIENAQFYEEAKEMQEQIAQAEKMATIGTMADGLSHQINNRFYALSLIAGDTIDTIRMTDTEKCTPEVKQMIDSINKALERIQANVIQGGEVV